MDQREIQVKLERLKKVAEKMAHDYEEKPYDKEKISSILKNNKGSVYNELFNLNDYTDVCVNVTRGLIKESGDFLKNAAKFFEEVDTDLFKGSIEK